MDKDVKIKSMEEQIIQLKLEVNEAENFKL